MQYLVVKKVPAPFLAFSDTLTGVQGALLSPCEGASLDALAVCAGVHGVTVLFCGVCLEQTSDCVNVFCLGRLTPLGQGERAFVGVLFCLHLFVFLDCQSIQFEVWEMRPKRKPRKLTTVVPLVLRFQASLFFPSHLSDSLMFVLCIMSGVFSYAWWEEQEKLCLLRFPGWESSVMFLNFQIIFLFL